MAILLALLASATLAAQTRPQPGTRLSLDQLKAEMFVTVQGTGTRFATRIPGELRAVAHSRSAAGPAHASQQSV